MKIIRVLENQTVQDIAVQYYGSIEGQWYILQDNEEINSITDKLRPGQLIRIRHDQPINPELVDYFTRNNIAIVTGSSKNADMNGDFNEDFSNDFNIIFQI